MGKKLFKLVTAACAAGLALVVGCGDSVVDSREQTQWTDGVLTTAAVNVVVRDGATGEIVPGAVVTLADAESGTKGRKLTSSDAGVAAFSDVFVGTYRVVVDAGAEYVGAVGTAVVKRDNQLKSGDATDVPPGIEAGPLNGSSEAVEGGFFIAPAVSVEIHVFKGNAELKGYLWYAEGGAKVPAEGAKVRLEILHPNLLNKVFDATANDEGLYTFENLPAVGHEFKYDVAMPTVIDGSVAGFTNIDAGTPIYTVTALAYQPEEDGLTYQAFEIVDVPSATEALRSGVTAWVDNTREVEYKSTTTPFVVVGAHKIAVPTTSSEVRIPMSQEIDVKASRVASSNIDDAISGITITGEEFNVDYDGNEIVISPIRVWKSTNFSVVIADGALIAESGDVIVGPVTVSVNVSDAFFYMGEVNIPITSLTEDIVLTFSKAIDTEKSSKNPIRVQTGSASITQKQGFNTAIAGNTITLSPIGMWVDNVLQVHYDQYSIWSVDKDVLPIFTEPLLVTVVDVNKFTYIGRNPIRLANVETPIVLHFSGEISEASSAKVPVAISGQNFTTDISGNMITLTPLSGKWLSPAPTTLTVTGGNNGLISALDQTLAAALTLSIEVLGIFPMTYAGADIIELTGAEQKIILPFNAVIDDEKSADADNVVSFTPAQAGAKATYVDNTIEITAPTPGGWNSNEVKLTVRPLLIAEGDGARLAAAKEVTVNVRGRLPFMYVGQDSIFIHEDSIGTQDAPGSMRTKLTLTMSKAINPSSAVTRADAVTIVGAERRAVSTFNGRNINVELVNTNDRWRDGDTLIIYRNRITALDGDVGVGLDTIVIGRSLPPFVYLGKSVDTLYTGSGYNDTISLPFSHDIDTADYRVDELVKVWNSTMTSLIGVDVTLSSSNTISVYPTLGSWEEAGAHAIIQLTTGKFKSKDNSDEVLKPFGWDPDESNYQIKMVMKGGKAVDLEDVVIGGLALNLLDGIYVNGILNGNSKPNGSVVRWGSSTVQLMWDRPSTGIGADLTYLDIGGGDSSVHYEVYARTIGQNTWRQMGISGGVVTDTTTGSSLVPTNKVYATVLLPNNPINANDYEYAVVARNGISRTKLAGTSIQSVVSRPQVTGVGAGTDANVNSFAQASGRAMSAIGDNTGANFAASLLLAHNSGTSFRIVLEFSEPMAEVSADSITLVGLPTGTGAMASNLSAGYPATGGWTHTTTNSSVEIVINVTEPSAVNPAGDWAGYLQLRGLRSAAGELVQMRYTNVLDLDTYTLNTGTQVGADGIVQIRFDSNL